MELPREQHKKIKFKCSLHTPTKTENGETTRERAEKFTVLENYHLAVEEGSSQ